MSIGKMIYETNNQKKFIIKDNVGNRLYPHKEFNCEQKAWDFLHKIFPYIGEEFFTNFQVETAKKFIIKDWGNNRLFQDKEFDSFEEGWDFLLDAFNDVDDFFFDQFSIVEV